MYFKKPHYCVLFYLRLTLLFWIFRLSVDWSTCNIWLFRSSTFQPPPRKACDVGGWMTQFFETRNSSNNTGGGGGAGLPLREFADDGIPADLR